MPKNFRQILIAVITFLSGLYFFLEFLLPEKIGEVKFSVYHDQISKGFAVLGAMAFGLGIINILRVHGTALLRAKRGFLNSLALLLGLFGMLLVEGGEFLQNERKVQSWKRLADLADFSALIAAERERAAAEPRARALEAALHSIVAEAEAGDGYLSLTAADERHQRLADALRPDLTEAAQRAAALREGYGAGPSVQPALHTELEASLRTAAEHARDLSTYTQQQSRIHGALLILRNGFFIPLGAAMFSLLGFYIATAAYRSFRLRSWEAGVMMLAAVLVVLGQIPQGPLYIAEGLPLLRLWLLENLSTPAFRAIFFGSAIAGLAMAMRMWLSLEKSPLALDGEEQ